MFGRSRSDTSAQLALLDAMVFFAGALLVTGMMFSQRATDSEAHEDGIAGVCDPADLLDALMKASVGEPMELATQRMTTLTGCEEISQVLSFELDELVSGTPAEVFAEFNGIIRGALLAACTPAMELHLVAFVDNGSFDRPLLAIPSPATSVSVAVSSSVTLPSHWGGQYIVVLVLDPASPSE